MNPEELQDLLERSGRALSRGASFSEVDSMVAEDSRGEFRDYTALRVSRKLQGVRDIQAGEEQDGNRVRFRDVVRSGAQGALFGFADEVAGIGAAIIPGGRGFGEAVAESRRREAAFKRQHPSLAASLEIGGAIASAFIPAGAIANVARGGKAALAGGRALRAGTVAKAAGGVQAAARAGRTLPGTVGRAAGFGAAGAGVEAVGRAEGGIGERLRDLPEAATTGAAIGAAIPIAGRAFGGVGRRIRDIARPAAAAERRGEQAVAGAVAGREGGAGLATARRRLTEFEEVRPGQATLADVTPEAQSLLDVAVSGSPRAARKAEDLLERRQGGQVSRIIRDIEELVGGTPNVRAAIEDHAEELSGLGRRLYEPLERAFPRIEATGAVRAPRGAPGAGRFISSKGAKEIQAFVNRPVVSRAFRVVNAIEEMVNPRAGAPSFKQLQDIRIKLGRARARLVAQGDKRGARDFAEASKQLTDLMENVLPGFRSANRQYARLASVGDALELGTSAWKRSAVQVGEEIAEAQARGGPRAADAYRLAMVEGLIDDLRKVASNRNVSRRFTAASEDFAGQLRQAFPDERQLAELLRRAEIEDLFAKTAGAGGNSATARRLAAFEEIAGERGVIEAAMAGGVRGGATGAVAGGLSEVAAKVGGRPRKFLGEVSERVGEALTLQEREGMFALLDQLERVQQGVQRRLDRAATLQIGAAGFLGRETALPEADPRLGALVP